MRRTHSLLLWLALIVLVGCSKEKPVDEARDSRPEKTVVAQAEIDPVTGLKMSGDWELVRGNFTACHSSKLTSLKRGSTTTFQCAVHQ